MEHRNWDFTGIYGVLGGLGFTVNGKGREGMDKNMFAALGCTGLREWKRHWERLYIVGATIRSSTPR